MQGLSSSDCFRCPSCGFELWNPICQMNVSFLGLYDDGRFPGRTILVLNEHFEHWEDIPRELLNEFVADSQRAMRAMSALTGASRINLAVLGNTDAHVHFHLIPRRRDSEPNPSKSPWNDPRPLTKLSRRQIVELVEELRSNLGTDIPHSPGNGGVR
jgi:diadenosine tetraphosphate (Ap4A) HIT family hydrolase